MWERQIKYVCQTNLDVSSHAIEKSIKASEKLEFECESNIDLKMELVWQIDKAGELIKYKYGLIHQMETRVQDTE